MVWDRLPESIKEEYGENYLRWKQKLVAGYLDYKTGFHPEMYPVVDAYFNAITSGKNSI